MPRWASVRSTAVEVEGAAPLGQVGGGRRHLVVVLLAPAREVRVGLGAQRGDLAVGRVAQLAQLARDLVLHRVDLAALVRRREFGLLARIVEQPLGLGARLVAQPAGARLGVARDALGVVVGLLVDAGGVALGLALDALGATSRVGHELLGLLLGRGEGAGELRAEALIARLLALVEFVLELGHPRLQPLDLLRGTGALRAALRELPPEIADGLVDLVAVVAPHRRGEGDLLERHVTLRLAAAGGRHPQTAVRSRHRMQCRPPPADLACGTHPAREAAREIL